MVAGHVLVPVASQIGPEKYWLLGELLPRISIRKRLGSDRKPYSAFPNPARYLGYPERPLRALRATPGAARAYSRRQLLANATIAASRVGS
jgi:hypothetical protein